MDYQQEFKQFLKDSENTNDYFYRCYGELHVLAAEKGIEFDGYPTKDLTDDNESEEFFDNQDRQNLYVLKSVEKDVEIRNLFLSIYSIVNLPVPTAEDISKSIKELEDSCVKF